MNSNGFKTYSMAHIGQSKGSAAEEKSKLQESHVCYSSVGTEHWVISCQNSSVFYTHFYWNKVLEQKC